LLWIRLPPPIIEQVSDGKVKLTKNAPASPRPPSRRPGNIGHLKGGESRYVLEADERELKLDEDGTELTDKVYP